MAQSTTLRSFIVALAVPAATFTVSVARAGSSQSTSAPSEEAAEDANWITFAAGGAFISGDDTGFKRRTQTNDFYGGIESLQYSKSINDSTTLTLDGHAMPGLEDYDFNLKLEKNDVGYVKAGFKQFRTWYDASGGYLQGANRIGADNLFGDEQSLDRGEIYFETGLRMDNVPEITFSYRHLYRDGQKDSTCWGDTQPNPNWGGIAGSNVAFKMMPAVWDINETTDIFQLNVEHTLGITDLGMGLVYETYNLDNSRNTPRWSLSTAPAATLGINDISLTEKTQSDIFAGNIHGVTRFCDQAWLSYAASYSSMDTDISGGSRSFGTYWPVPLPAAPSIRDYAYDQMSGGSSVGQFISNLNFMWVPVQDLTVTPSLRYEHESIDTISNFRAFNSNQTWQGLESLGANTDTDVTTGALDLRYTGLSDIVLYAKGQWEREDESVHRVDRFLRGEFLSTDVGIDEQEYTIGANWYALRNLSFAIQGFYSERNQSLDHVEGNQQALDPTLPGGANNMRPIMAEHDTKVDDINLRMTWRPLGNVSLVTRYDYRHTEYDNSGINWSINTDPLQNIDPAVYYPGITSGKVDSNILSQSVTWNPIDSLYLQGTVSWISARTKTPDVYVGDATNDYLCATLSAGYAIDKKTEITASYTYYGASDYTNSVGFTGVKTMGYGFNTQENSVGVTLTRVLTPNMIWNLHYGFISSNTDSPDQSGGYSDFDAHMVSTGLQVRF